MGAHPCGNKSVCTQQGRNKTHAHAIAYTCVCVHAYLDHNNHLNDNSDNQYQGLSPDEAQIRTQLYAFCQTAPSLFVCPHGHTNILSKAFVMS